MRWNQWADPLAVGEDAIQVNFGAAGGTQALVLGHRFDVPCWWAWPVSLSVRRPIHIRSHGHVL